MKFYIVIVYCTMLLLSLFRGKEDGLQLADPGTLAVIAIGSTIAGGLLQAKAAKDSAKAEVAMHKLNAKITQEDIKQKRRAQLEDQHIRRDNARRNIATMRAKLAGSGVTLEGSSLEVLLQATEDLASDIAVVNLERGAEISRLRTQVGVDLAQAKNARSAGRLAVAAALVGGAGSTASTAIRLRKTSPSTVRPATRSSTRGTLPTRSTSSGTQGTTRGGLGTLPGIQRSIRR